MLRRLFILLALLLAPAVASGQNIRPQLIAEGPAPAGGEVELAIHMRTAPSWHGYWQNPGDAGLPMTVDWELPPGFVPGPLRYPVPTRLTVAGIMNYVFERDYAVLVRLKVPASATGVISIRAKARWLACTDKICVPEQGSFGLDIPVGAGTPQRARFDEWRRALPQPLLTAAKFNLVGDKLNVAIPLPRESGIGEPYIFPHNDGPVDYAAPQEFRRSGDTLIAELKRRRGVPREFAGVLALGDGRGLEFTALPGAVPEGGKRIGELGTTPILLAILGALAGGLLLNLMPCVFPILAIKALHLARSGGEAGHARRDALAYTAGAIVGTGALGAALLAIRAGGSAAGWAFQLQDPRTIMLLMLLSLAITLNLLRVFELPVISGNARPAGSFGTGALAAFVATPCAGPFLGVALGTALLLPHYGAILVFAALGLGLALPFLAIGFIPALRQRLPKPGAWMVRLQRFLAIPMAATALACLWLLYRQGGELLFYHGVIAGALLIGAILGFNRPERIQKAAGWVMLALIPIIVVQGLGSAAMRPASSSVPAGDERWSPAFVDRHLDQGRPVFVYFTADWCLTCKANEIAAIDRAKVRKSFKQAGVRVLVADWTNGDPDITRFLESRARAGVPLYLWYRPGAQAEELPQVLTQSMLISRARRDRRRE